MRNWVKLYMTWTHSMEQLDFLIMASLYITPCFSHDVICICPHVMCFFHDVMRYVMCSCKHVVWLFSLYCLRLSLCGVLLSLFDVLLSLGDVILLLCINFRKQLKEYRLCMEFLLNVRGQAWISFCFQASDRLWYNL